MSKKGFSLIEILIALGILGIMTGIATVSYQGYRGSAEKMNLKHYGVVFAGAVKNCIRLAGGWEVDIWDDANDRTQKGFPCKVAGASIKEDLKKKLDFTCPAGATCETETKDTVKYHCLSIKKEVSGKYLQVLVRLPYDNPIDYQIWCGEMASASGYLALGANTCKKENTWNKVENNSNIQTDLQTTGFKQGDDCWK